MDPVFQPEFIVVINMSHLFRDYDFKHRCNLLILQRLFLKFSDCNIWLGIPECHFRKGCQILRHLPQQKYHSKQPDALSHMHFQLKNSHLTQLGRES